MPLLPKTLRDLFCCFGLHEQDITPPATLRDLPQASVTSVALPTTTIPSATLSNDELQRIFATNSTPNGYYAAKDRNCKRPMPQGSLDLTFQFASGSTHQKHPSRVGPITQNIKHGNLETNKSKRGCGGDLAVERVPKISTPSAKDENNDVLGISQRSTGLTDLLASRAPSEGGYDSDARSIRTPLLQSRTGTIDISPGLVRKPLKTIESEGWNEVTNRRSSIDIENANSKNESNGNIDNSSDLEESPTEPSYPTPRTCAKKSQTELLCRFASGTDDDPTRAPNTPELRAVRLPSMNSTQKEWRLNMSAPKRDFSDVHQGDQSDSSVTLSQRTETIQRENLASIENHQRGSLISNLDPVVLGYLKQCDLEQNTKENPVTAPPPAPLDVRMSSSTEPGRGLDYAIHAAAMGEAGQPSDSPMITNPADSISKACPTHLYDMRISQRLASESNTQGSMLDDSTNASSRSLQRSISENIVQTRPISANRYPTFIAAEHNRRPSDPRTRCLFEEARHKRKPTDVDSTRQSSESAKKAIAVVNSSSTYSSQADGSQDILQARMSQQRSVTIQNPNSLAIGGRSVFMNAPHAQYRDTSQADIIKMSIPSQLGRNYESIPAVASIHRTGQNQNRNHGVTEFSMSEDHSVLHHNNGKLVGRSTTENEEMSIESLSHALDKRNENMSEVPTEGINKGCPLQQDYVTSAVRGSSIPLPIDYSQKSMSSKSNYSRNDPPPEPTILAKQIAPLDDPHQIGIDHYHHPSWSSLSRSMQQIKPLQAPSAQICARRCRPFKHTLLPTKLVHRSMSDLSKHELEETNVQPRRRSQSVDSMPNRAKTYKKPSWIFRSPGISPFRGQVRTVISKGALRKKSLNKLVKTLKVTNVQEAEASQNQNPWLGVNFGTWAGVAFGRNVRRDEPKIGSSIIANDSDSEERKNFESKDKMFGNESQQAHNSYGSVRCSKSMKSKLDRAKTRSLNFSISAEERARKRNQGLVERFRRFCRASSPNLKMYGHNIANDDDQPGVQDMTCLHSVSTSQGDRIHLTLTGQATNDTSNETFNHSINADVPNLHIDAGLSSSTPKNTVDWGQLYAECVGSLSALKSDLTLEESRRHEKSLSLSSACKSSTEDFDVKLPKETEKEIQTRLLHLALGSETQSVSGDASKHQKRSNELKMPGSFD